ncbi:MAG: Hsp33 family molecular chaperone HslO [Ethanoligenens sp.]|uniref:Hsp33 family molecular chaperone HslO n=1 Tax=Ethanoligenens sp. TaxID=2099655 RepID=UPI0039E8BAFB
MGKLIRAITGDGTIVAYALDATDMVQRAVDIHQTSAVVTAALGRLLTAASMMGVMLKGKDDSITLRVKADGPAGTLLAVSDSEGNTKGYVENPVVEIPLNTAGKLDVGAAVGHHGTLQVLKDLNLKEPYVGHTPIVSGEIAEDITQYLATSEQVPSVCALGVLVNPDLSVRVAGGFIIQLLPFADEAAIEKLEQNIKHVPAVTTAMDAGQTPEDLVRQALDGFSVEILDERTAGYVCDCSRERVENALRSMGETELRAMIAEQGGAEVVCHFCGQKYQFNVPELKGLITPK